ncbi:MAG: peptidoglycan DD-metalloendopeptidase family protein [Patescibacteria group bacterium]
MAFTLPAEAFFSSIFADKVSAETKKPKPESKNSQNIGLLQANASVFSILEEKKSKDKDADTDADTENIIIDDTLTATINPLDILVSTKIDFSNTDNTDESIYIVREGDSLSQIAKMFDVSANTIRWANNIKLGEKLKAGDVLIVLPISGVEHEVLKGQTVKSIAEKYKVNINDIVVYNDITEDTKLVAGIKLIIPEGEMVSGDKKDKNNYPNNYDGNSVLLSKKDKNFYLKNPLKSIFGYFINPVPAGHKTQGLHGARHRGIDIGAKTGTPIYASAEGIVLKASSFGWNGGYGKMIIIQHPNNTKTLYAHMNKVDVVAGIQIARGQIIGAVGSTGNSTGPHLHFEVHNAQNPGSNWSWAKSN